MKILKLFFSAIIVMVLCVGISSCSKDDNNSSSNPLVGTWVRTETWNNGQKYYKESYTFKNDGSGIWSISGTEQNETSNFKYSFNQKTLEITITQDGETWTDKFESFSDTSFKYDGGVFYKQ